MTLELRGITLQLHNFPPESLYADIDEGTDEYWMAMGGFSGGQAVCKGVHLPRLQIQPH